VNKAILEHGQTGPFLAHVWRNLKLSIPRSSEDIRTLQDHALYYCDPCHLKEFERWRIAADTVQTQGERANRWSCSESPNPRVAIVDLTPPDLEESPFRVVRGIARELQPIWYGHGFERTFTARLLALLNGREPNRAPPPIC
jgi:ribosomal protein S12 methylthiotransferase accessory factor